MPECSNIKDRQNRKCVERLLKVIIGRLKTIKEVNNGLIVLAGIDKHDEEFVIVAEPPIKNDKLIYKCDSKFHMDEIEPLFKKQRETSYVILLTGDETKIYSYDNNFKLIDKLNGNLIKRQRNGGQSSVRFSRLAEESRHNYILRIVDKVNKYCKNGKKIIVLGSRELKGDLMDCKDVTVFGNDKSCSSQPKGVKLETIDKFYEIGNNFINENKKELELLLNKSNNQHEKQIEEVYELIKKDPDLLTFGKDIIEAECEYIIQINEEQITHNDINKTIIIDKNSKFYGLLKAYGRIGKKYFKFEES